MSQEFVQNYLESLRFGQKDFLKKVVGLKVENIWLSFDLDGILSNSWIPVFDYCDKDLGTHYNGRKLLGFGTVAKWLMEDGVFKTDDEATAYEDSLWDNPKILAAAPPNETFQKFSVAAAKAGIPQIVTTSRPPEMKFITRSWVQHHYPQIPYLNIRHDNRLTGEDFKAGNVARIFKWNPKLVHFEDSLRHVSKIEQLARNIGIIAFPYPTDSYNNLTARDNKIYIPDMSVFESIVAQSC